MSISIKHDKAILAKYAIDNGACLAKKDLKILLKKVPYQELHSFVSTPNLNVNEASPTYKILDLLRDKPGFDFTKILACFYIKAAEKGDLARMQEFNCKLAYTLNGRLPGTEYYIAADDPRITGNSALNQLGGMYMVAPGVVQNSDGSYSPNTKLITVESYYKEYNRIANVETNSFDASYLKLREVRFDYSVPRKHLDNTPFTSVSLGVYGRNLLMITSYPLFDPETVALNGSSIVPGIETGSLPSTRNLGINLNISF